MKIKLLALLAFLLLLPSLTATAYPQSNFNKEIIKTVEWLAENKAGLGFKLRGARYTEDLKYGDYTFRATGGTKTMCVAAVLEIMIRTMEQFRKEQPQFKIQETLSGKQIDSSSPLNLMPYIFQFKSSINFPQYKRNFVAGAPDAFVLFGIGSIVNYSEATPGDFIYFNRPKESGHAAIFISYLASDGSTTDNASKSVGFRYFSAQQGGTNGFGYRDAFFGQCPKVDTKYKKDCKVIKSDSRNFLSIGRLYHPSDWFTNYSAIRVERFLAGETAETILADEAKFRLRADKDQKEAERKAKEAAKRNVFPIIIPDIAQEDLEAGYNILEKDFSFSDQFGPDFSEPDSED